MAFYIEPEVQLFFETQDLFEFGIHKVKLRSSNNTFVAVPRMVADDGGDVTAGAAGELDDGNNSNITSLAATDLNTVTITGGAMDEFVWFATMHRRALRVNSGEDR